MSPVNSGGTAQVIDVLGNRVNAGLKAWVKVRLTLGVGQGLGKIWWILVLLES